MIKNIPRKRKNGNIYHNIFYMGALPKPILELIQPRDNTIYFYEKNNKIYLTGVEPRNSDYEAIKVQKINRHYSLPKRFFNLNKDNKKIKLILNLNIYNQDKSIEVITL